MKAERREKLIISLIEDDLIHSKLVEGLIELGLKAEDYFLNLSDTIICLMGFEGNSNEQLFEYYLDLLKQAKFIDNSENNRGFKKLAQEIYYRLQSRKTVYPHSKKKHKVLSSQNAQL